jgi:membrane protein involved in colicin uptake
LSKQKKKFTKKIQRNIAESIISPCSSLNRNVSEQAIATNHSPSNWHIIHALSVGIKTSLKSLKSLLIQSSKVEKGDTQSMEKRRVQSMEKRRVQSMEKRRVQSMEKRRVQSVEKSSINNNNT